MIVALIQFICASNELNSGSESLILKTCVIEW